MTAIVPPPVGRARVHRVRRDRHELSRWRAARCPTGSASNDTSTRARIRALYLLQLRETIELTGRLTVDDVDALQPEARDDLMAAFRSYQAD